MRVLVILLAFMFSGCAFDVIRVQQVSTKLETAILCNDIFVLAQDIDVQLGNGYSRTLKKGTKWRCVGKITQGEVYKTRDQILTVEASNIFEANIVVVAKNLVGFYLPVERTFTPLSTPTALVMRDDSSS